jgi:catechol 2,3-dioxygenase-like lactoylglutathione lyase family enzyme
VRLNIAIVFVSDMRRSIAFYRDVLGLPLEFESSHWTQFDASGAKLALHAAGAGGVEPPSRAGSCRPGFAVPDLDAFHRRMLEQKVSCAQAPTDTFGVRVAQYLDPDGLTINVAQERRGAPPRR